MYFFSNSPVRCRLTKVVLPTPPSPTRMSLNLTALGSVFVVVPGAACAQREGTGEGEGGEKDVDRWP